MVSGKYYSAISDDSSLVIGTPLMSVEDCLGIIICMNLATLSEMSLESPAQEAFKFAVQMYSLLRIIR